MFLALRARFPSLLLLALLTWGPASELQAQQIQERHLAGLKYRCIGPTRGGRVTAVAGDATHAGTFYMGGTGGGVWKTTDYGQSWRIVTDGFLATGSIGAIRVAPSNPDVIWVGTGSDGLRSNVITGRGVYRSTDAGRTWKFLGLRDAGQIGAVEIHPEDPDVAWVAVIGQAFGPSAERGVFKTTDGGMSWKHVLFVSKTCGAVDLELAPDDPDTLYACMWRGERKPWTIISGAREGGLYRSRDGGGAWQKLTEGLPSGLFGKSDLAVSPADPARVYALIEAPAPDGGLYRSDDHGDTFSRISDRSSLLDRPFYYTNVDADPTDADVVYVSSTGFYRSADGGRSWRRRRTPHGDNHDLWIHPGNPLVMIQSNDGGANVTRDGGKTWSTQRNQPTAELYSVEVDGRFPYWVYSGQQDNSTIRVPSLPPHGSPLGPMGFWESVGGCETGPAVPKPGDPDIVYANCKGKFGRFNMRTGQERHYYVGAANMYGHNPRDLKYRFQRVAPVHVSPHDPGIVYHASQYLHRTRDEGVTWERISPDLTANKPSRQVISGEPITRDITGEEFYSTIYSVRESPLQPGLIWVGANDGPVHVTRNAGKSWRNVTPEGLPPGGRVDAVEPSPHRKEKAYIAVYRFLLGDWQPYIWRTADYGRTWTRLTTSKNGIPADTPTRVVREDPDREGLLYAGTEFGVYVSFDDGGQWHSLKRNLPTTPVTDMKVHRNDLVISTMGRSFWILDDLTPLHQLTPEIAGSSAHLFAPADAWRTRYRPTRGGGAGPEYPSPGARIDYWLAEEPEGDLKLEILDDQGRIVRTVSSRSRGRRPRQEGRPSMRGPRRMAPRPSRLTKEAGMHRFVWDFRLKASGRGGRRGGPLALPGRYEVRLSAGEWRAAQPLTVRLDPRVAADGITLADLKAQQDLQLRIQEVQARARRLTASIRSRRTTLEEGQDPDEQVLEKLDALRDRLVTKRGRYPTPMLNDQLSYLAGMLAGADQRPGQDAYERLASLTEELQSCEKEFESL